MKSCQICYGKFKDHFIIPISTCENHFICTNCFDSTSNEEKVLNEKCKDCDDFFFPAPYSLNNQLCSYCLGSQSKKIFCPNHNPCLSCIQLIKSNNIKSKCFCCLKLSKKFCMECKKYKDLIKMPFCQDHHYCKNCLREFRTKVDECLEEIVIDCIDCYLLISPHESTRCTMCKEYINEFDTVLTQGHSICIRCDDIITDNKNYIQFLYCNECNDILTNRKGNGYNNKYSLGLEENKLELLYEKQAKTLDGVIVKNTEETNTMPSIEKNDEKNFEQKNLITKIQNPIENATVPEKKNDILLYSLSKEVYPQLLQCHGQYWGILECKHPACDICFMESFRFSFNDFITKLINKDANSLNSSNYEIRCPREDCLCRFCYPFDRFRNVALSVLAEKNVNEFICDYYGMIFEGIRILFKVCNYCYNIYGNVCGVGNCIYCGCSS